MIEEWRKVAWVLNRRYGYHYIAKMFNCSIDEIVQCEEELVKKGHYIEDWPRDDNLSPKLVKAYRRPKITRRYIRLFKNYQNVEQAIEMLNAGYSYHQIGNALGCDRSSVTAFHKRKRKEGIIFIDYLVEEGARKKLDPSKLEWQEHWIAIIPINKWVPHLKINIGTDRETAALPYYREQEKINEGKSSYEEYLKEYKNEIKESRESRMLAAKQTIEDLRKWRRKNGIKELDIKELDHVKINWSLIKDL